MIRRRFVRWLVALFVSFFGFGAPHQPDKAQDAQEKVWHEPTHTEVIEGDGFELL